MTGAYQMALRQTMSLKMKRININSLWHSRWVVVKVINMHPAPYKQEGSFTFDQDLFDNCEDNVNLYGYFQCEKYF